MGRRETWSFWRRVSFWRIGPGQVVLYVAIFAALGVGYYLIGQEQAVTCRRQNASGRVLRDLAAVALHSTERTRLLLPRRLRAAQREGERDLERALWLTVVRLRPRRC